MIHAIAKWKWYSRLCPQTCRWICLRFLRSFYHSLLHQWFFFISYSFLFSSSSSLKAVGLSLNALSLLKCTLGLWPRSWEYSFRRCNKKVCVVLLSLPLTWPLQIKFFISLQFWSAFCVQFTSMHIAYAHTHRHLGAHSRCVQLCVQFEIRLMRKQQHVKCLASMNETKRNLCSNVRPQIAIAEQCLV